MAGGQLRMMMKFFTLDRESTVNWILVVAVWTLAIQCLAVVGVFLIALFNQSVNNERIFEIIGPAFNTIIGAFVGLIGGISLSKSRDHSKE